MSLLLTNRFGATQATCERHREYYQKHIYGATVTGETAAPCEQCEGEIRGIIHPYRVFQALTSGKLAHTRARKWCGQWSVNLYRRESSSPSGVLLDVSCDMERFDRMFDELRRLGMVSSSLSPLSQLNAFCRSPRSHDHPYPSDSGRVCRLLETLGPIFVATGYRARS